VSNHFGFAISSIVLAISLAGFTAMLVAAFLLGRRQTVGHRDEEPDERDRLYLPDEGSAFLRPGYKP
ncbi:MAG: hypothetical protein ACRDYV_09075, partial [Acidimicrobiia bacterium]